MYLWSYWSYCLCSATCPTEANREFAAGIHYNHRSDIPRTAHQQQYEDRGLTEILVTGAPASSLSYNSVGDSVIQKLCIAITFQVRGEKASSQLDRLAVSFMDLARRDGQVVGAVHHE